MDELKTDEELIFKQRQLFIDKQREIFLQIMRELNRDQSELDADMREYYSK